MCFQGALSSNCSVAFLCFSWYQWFLGLQVSFCCEVSVFLYCIGSYIHYTNSNKISLMIKILPFVALTSHMWWVSDIMKGHLEVRLPWCQCKLLISHLGWFPGNTCPFSFITNKSCVWLFINHDPLVPSTLGFQWEEASRDNDVITVFWKKWTPCLRALKAMTNLDFYIT